jgi:hypothetical protein
MLYIVSFFKKKLKKKKKNRHPVLFLFVCNCILAFYSIFLFYFIFFFFFYKIILTNFITYTQHLYKLLFIQKQGRTSRRSKKIKEEERNNERIVCYHYAIIFNIEIRLSKVLMVLKSKEI